MTTTIDLSGKTALVTGAGRGIGREIAARLAAAGADVAINDFAGEEQCEELAAEIRALGRKAIVAMGDVGDETAVDAIVAHVAKSAQGGDIVVVFSNGGFGGIHAKLLERLGRR